MALAYYISLVSDDGRTHISRRRLYRLRRSGNRFGRHLCTVVLRNVVVVEKSCSFKSKVGSQRRFSFVRPRPNLFRIPIRRSSSSLTYRLENNRQLVVASPLEVCGPSLAEEMLEFPVFVVVVEVVRAPDVNK